MRRLTGLSLIASLMLTSCTAAGRAAGSASSAPTRSPLSTDQIVSSRIYDAFSVRHLAAWKFVAVERHGAGPGVAVAYLTNQAAMPQCTTAFAGTAGPRGAYSVTCGSPVKVLQSNGVFITFTSDLGLLPSLATHNRILGGHPALVEQLSPASAQCPANATNATRVRLFVPHPEAAPAGSGEVVTMSACYAGPNTAAITQQVNALIGSITFA